MLIIRKGSNPALMPIEATCVRCDTVVQFLPHEAKFVADQRDGDFYQIACPVCSNPITANAQRGYNGPG